MERVKIDKACNLASVTFNSDFYDKNMIIAAAEDFKEIADITIDDLKVVLKPFSKSDLDAIGFELYNYVLSLMKNR